MDPQRIRACLFGLAFGDALGLPTEFLSLERIAARFPDGGPHGATHFAAGREPALVTDDTQMTLAVGEALLEVGPPWTRARLEPALRAHFVAWKNSPDNFRAPGRTCMNACFALEAGHALEGATVAGSKGCGANMRVAPAAFLPPEVRAGVAQLQAALTHGHPTALAASELTAEAIALLAGGCPPADLLSPLRLHARAARERGYLEDWVGEVWRAGSRGFLQRVWPGDGAKHDFAARGWDEVLVVLDRLEAALLRPDRDGDPCAATGAGWVAEEALATGLLCFLLDPDEPARALTRAARTSGDSDSIACLTGAFAGAALGARAWPAGWFEQVEYAPRLESLARGLGAFAVADAPPSR
ncbi:MAG: ADP-ribosylglycohydrolase family protein [Planctomycetota bacterium]